MKNTTQNSVAFRAQMEIGRRISKQLDPLLTQQQVGDKLGLSYEAVRRIEYRALGKVFIRLRNELREGI